MSFESDSKRLRRAFGLGCKEASHRPSIEPVGEAYENAVRERLSPTLECELVDRRNFQVKAAARLATSEFIENCYNPGQLHSALGDRPSID